jgi:hypothetical protein
MMPAEKGLGVLALFSTLALVSCGGNGGPIFLPNVNLSISPQPVSVPINSSVTFTSTVSSGINSPSWSLSGFASADVGSPDNQVGGSTFIYTAPATPPIYTGVAATNMTPGTVTVQASADFTGYASATFVITAPSVTVALSPATVSLALGATQNFTGYAVGNVNNALTAQVNGVTGGAMATGTIAAMPNSVPYGTYTYTAPSVMPMTGSTVTVTVISQADPTKFAAATITLH